MVPRTTLKIAFEMFILDCQSRRFTPHTLRFYRGRLGLWLRWCEQREIADLERLTHHHIRQYLVDLDQSGVSSAYHHSHARAIRAFLNYCVRDDLLELSPFDKVQMPRLEKKIPHAVPAADVARILRACSNERDRAIVLFAIDSGVRASELCALRVGDVRLDNGEVTVRQGKGQKERLTYIGAKVRKQVLRYFARERDGQPDATEPLFARRDDAGCEPLVYNGLKQIVFRLRKSSGVKFSMHAFRRTFAINALRNGMDLYTLARLMGHSDITVLRVYLELIDTDGETAHQKFGVVDRL